MPKSVFSALWRSGLSAAITIAMTVALLVGLSGTASAATCGPVVEKIIPSQSTVMVASRTGGGFYNFRTTTVNRSPAVLMWVNNRFTNTLTAFPVNLSGGYVYVYLKQERVLETTSGSPVYVLKYRPYVRACSAQWQVI